MSVLICCCCCWPAGEGVVPEPPNEGEEVGGGPVPGPERGRQAEGGG